MVYQLDDVDIGILAIAIMGTIGIAGMVYVNIYEGGDPDSVASFCLAIGGLIAALVRGKSMQ
jgi:hypothetical protein